MTITCLPCLSSQARNAARRALAEVGASTDHSSSATKLDVASRQNAARARSSPTLESLACVAVTAPAATSVQGCTMAAISAAVQGDIVSSLPSTAVMMRGRPFRRASITAITISAMPSASLAIHTAVPGMLRNRTGLAWVISSTMAITRTRHASQPRMKPRPFRVPSLVLRIRMKADSRNGCRAIPNPSRTRSATTPHLTLPREAPAASAPVDQGFHTAASSDGWWIAGSTGRSPF
jgi:hypothetical protein